MTETILSDIAPVYGFCTFKSVADKLIKCRAISKIPHNAKTVIVCLFPYYLGKDCYEGSNISKYAVVPDYHDIVAALLGKACERLKAAYPNEEFAAFTDNSPIPEVRAAVNAGLGVKGKNGLLINGDYGSWVFIGTIVTTKKYNCIESVAAECIGCNRCVNACPTGSITEKGINAEDCLSNVTQKKGELTAQQERLIINSGCIWGCDICQDVCPMNNNIKISPLEAFRSDVRLTADADDLSGRAYAWRGRKTIERNIGLLRNTKGETI